MRNVNSLLAHMNDTTFQLKFSTYRSQNHVLGLAKFFFAIFLFLCFGAVFR